MSKPPIDPVRWQAPPVNPLPDFASASITIVAVPGNAPEDVVVDAEGQIWTGVDDGRIVRISPESHTPSLVNTPLLPSSVTTMLPSSSRSYNAPLNGCWIVRMAVAPLVSNDDPRWTKV